MDPQLAREWIETAKRLQGTLESFPHRRASDSLPAGIAAQTGNVTVEVKDNSVPRAMSIAVHSAVLCAVLSMITLIVGSMVVLNMKDHLDAIYMIAPQLNKPTGDTSK